MAVRFDLVPLDDWGFFHVPPQPCVIAGPCSAESEAQVMETAKALKARGIHVLRAGLWKPRTHPGCFEGVGVRGLPWLKRVKDELGMKVCTEVASAMHVAECMKYGVDMVWLGARTTTNPFLVQELANALRCTDIPVLVKNPINPDPELWFGAFERLYSRGVRKLAAVHRGVSTLSKIKYRNAPQWEMAVELRTRYPEIPMFCDPSHMAGKREFLLELSQRAMALGFEGLMIECHRDPSCALSDADQQLTPSALIELLESLTVRYAVSRDERFNEEINQLRACIDVLDEDIVSALADRMKISRQIGNLKKDNNIAILQPARWDAVLEKVAASAEGYGIDPEFIRRIFNAIHDASVAEQNK